MADPKPPAAEQGLRLPPVEQTPAEAAERGLLKRELMQLERLLTMTPRNAPERAAIVKRLAESYAELARRAEHDRDIALMRAERTQQDEKAPAKPRQQPRLPIRM